MYKGGEKDPQSVKSYRPVTLLSVMGKVYEKILNNRILTSLKKERRLHGRQHGFRPRRGTEGAVLEILDRVQGSNKNYVLTVFLDIAGAFDNVWWPRINVKLNEYGITGNEIDVIKYYFEDRHAILRFRGVEQEKIFDKKMYTKVLFDSFLRLLLPQECWLYAYADDGLLLVKATSRIELERKASEACDKIHDWCSENKLKLNVAKTECMLSKKV